MRRNLRAAFVATLLASTLAARVGVTTVAAGTTIAVNLLEIKQTISKVRAASKATKKAVSKAAKKVAGK